MLDQWIDVHAHFTPPTTPELRHARWQAMRAELFMVPEPHQWSAETRLDYMDRAGIAMQMLSNIPKGLDDLRASRGRPNIAVTRGNLTY
jgi:hypothetical protein